MATTSLERPKIAITMGDPAGIGPEVVAKLLADPTTVERAHITLIGSRAEVEHAHVQAGLALPDLDSWDGEHIALVDDGAFEGLVTPGESSAEAGTRAMHRLRQALELTHSGETEAMVFASLNKYSLSLAGMDTEDDLKWFARELGYSGPTCEVNILPSLWTSRVTSHIPHSAVAAAVTPDAISRAIVMLSDALKATGIAEPRLAVCALNPHAGENGKYGREEIEVIAPAVEAAQRDGYRVSGPYPSDTVFIAAKRGDFDGVVTMYHDQGQIAMKLMGFDQGVTFLGGLPIIITTPAHGSAFDLVGQGKASSSALSRAIAVAADLAVAERERQ